MVNTPRHTFLVLIVWTLTGAVSLSEAPKPASSRDGFRQLAKLRFGLALRAREKEHSPVKAGLFYLQAAQAFRHAGAPKTAREALMQGIAAALPLRASWPRSVIAMDFLPGDMQFLTCGPDGRVQVWDVATGREVRSFRVEGTHKAAQARRPTREVVGAGVVEGASLSPDGSRLLVWEGKTLQLWDVARGRLLRKWDRPWQRASRGRRVPVRAGAVFLDGGKRLLLWGTGKAAEVWDVDGKVMLHAIDKGSVGDEGCLSRDGSRLLTADPSAVYLWDLKRGKRIQTFEAGSENRWSLRYRFSPDGKRVLVIGGSEGAPAAARLFDASTGKRLATFTASCFPVWRREGDAAVFSPDGTRLLTWGKGRRVDLWDVEHGRLLHTFGRGEYLSAQFHQGGTQVLTMGEPVRLWDAKTGKAVARYGDGYATFTRDGSRLLIRDVWKNRVEVWDVKGQKRVRVFETPGSPQDILLSEDETLLLARVSSESGALQLWDLGQPEGRLDDEEDPLPRARIFQHDKSVRTAALSRDKTRLLTCEESGLAHLWDTARMRRVRLFAHGDGILGAAFNPDESRVLTWGEEGAVKLWETKTGKELRTFKHPADVREAAFSRDGSHLLTRDADYTVWWWDVARRKPVHKFEHPRDVFGAGLSPRGRRVLTWGLDGKARLWDVASGRLVRSLAHPGPVFGATFSSEHRVWTWSPAGLREWDVTKGKLLRRQRLAGGVAAAELSRDGKRFLLRTGEGAVQLKLWDVSAGKGLVTFDTYGGGFGSSERLSAGVFNSDQTRILARSDKSAHLWDVASGVRLKWFRHSGAVRGTAFSRDESLVLTWGTDGTARLWEALVRRPLSPDNQLLELEVRSGLHIDENGGLRSLKPWEWQDRRKKLESGLKKNKRR
jgi:WD40 repeat protein